MAARSHASATYRFGFNGKENDREINGTGNALDFGARIYDSRLGRWLSVDPLASKYPDLSAYVYVNNTPIIFIDIDGKEITVTDPETGLTHVWKPGAKVPARGSKFLTDTYRALDYLYKTPDKDGVNRVDYLVKSTYRLRIVQTLEPMQTRFSAGEGNLSEERIIYFNNYEVDIFDDGKKQSPVVSLAHELDHSWRFFKLRAKYLQSNSDADYEMLQNVFFDPGSKDNKDEEQRATRGYESLISKKQNGHIRKDYYIENSPASIDVTDDVLKTEEGGSCVPTDIRNKIIENGQKEIEKRKNGK